MACWNVGRLVQRIVVPRKPGEKKILSAAALARQSSGFGLPNSSSSSAAAWSSAAYSESRHAARSPFPQKWVLNRFATGRPRSVLRSLST